MNTLATGSYHNRRFEIRCPDDITEKGRRGPVWSLFLYEGDKVEYMVQDRYFVDCYQKATAFLNPTYTHIYTLHFTVPGSTCPKGTDVTHEMLRHAVLKRRQELDTEGWIDDVGDPIETHRE